MVLIAPFSTLNVTFWGTSHALMQFIVIVKVFKDRRDAQVHRLRVLVLGLTFPLLALADSAWLGDSEL